LAAHYAFPQKAPLFQAALPVIFSTRFLLYGNADKNVSLENPAY
jgi:hypothetical protein